MDIIAKLIPMDFVNSMVRHALTAGAAWLGSHAIANNDAQSALVAGGMAVFGIVWSFIFHTTPDAPKA